jgi:hypothetical protein
MKQWHELIDFLAPSVVKIESPQGHGTGFLLSYNEDQTVTAIATAHHVVSDADKWVQPIRIYSAGSGRTVVLAEKDRRVRSDPIKDSAVVLIRSSDIRPLSLPMRPIQLLRKGEHLKAGVDVAWLGFPGIGPDTLCFFAGKVSAWQSYADGYLIDGVAINGVSGGPAFCRESESETLIVGALTAYMPNRITNESLPGLSVAKDVSHFQSVIVKLKDWDEARRQKKFLEYLNSIETEVPPELFGRGPQKKSS